jgi:hypothetical protein
VASYGGQRVLEYPGEAVVERQRGHPPGQPASPVQVPDRFAERDDGAVPGQPRRVVVELGRSHGQR